MIPGNRAEDEQVPSVFDEDPDLAREKLAREYRRVRSALVTSGVLIVLPLIIGHVLSVRLGGLSTMGIAAAAMLIVCTYIALGAFAMRKPFTAMIAGICIYSLLQAVTIFFAPDEPLTAWIFRALVVMNLLMPIQKARAIQRRVEI